MTAFCDADWAVDVDDRKSISGMCVYLGSNLVSWSAKKQHTISRSSTESEYRSIASTTAELAWFQSLLSELGVILSKPPIIWSDNISAIAISKNPVLHARTRHIEIDLLFVRDKVAAHTLLVQYVPSLDQLADIFTKPLPLARFCTL